MKTLCYSLLDLCRRKFNSNKNVIDFIKSNEKEIDKIEDFYNNSRTLIETENGILEAKNST